ncbi:sulfurtransferase TusA family protein [Rhodobacteraceae bacterium]|nr:sulfurtransferase TusA family protein [Paracoccaceae bacterium]
MTFDEELDALGLLCPLPVLKAAKRLRTMKTGAVLKVITDDPAAVIDVPHFCTEQAHELIDTQDHNAHQVFFIQKS